MRESPALDPFGDFEQRGYLRNHFGLKNLDVLAHIETALFQSSIVPAMRLLRRSSTITYSNILQTHHLLFNAVYPWAGEDRRQNAPHLAITKAGYNNLFAHPQDVQRAAEYALRLALDHRHLRARPGEVFAYLAHAHPFLEGNGRTLLTVFAELCRRAHFYIAWEQIEKAPFLHALTADLLQPGDQLDRLLYPFCLDGTATMRQEADRLRVKFGR